MSRKLASKATICVLAGFIVLAGSTTKGDWFESFDGDQLDVATWDFVPLPDVTKTFTHTILTDPNGNKYLSMNETTSEADNGSQFGAGYVEEIFTDVRVGAIVNVTGDASRTHHGLMARLTYIIDPDGSIIGAPGFAPLAVYVMHINWENGPANLRIDIEKVVNVSNIMRNEAALGLDLYVPDLNHARSYYAELDVLGSGPVYVTGRLYEYRGGPLVAKTETMVDTSGNDPWEEDVGSDAPFLSGNSGIFAQNQNETPPGYHTTFDDVFSTSTPAAVMPSPADGATDASVNAELSWVEASSATGRELWFGKVGAMEKIDPAPTGATYNPGDLEIGQTYQWRVDQIGQAGTVEGLVWTFTTAEYVSVEDFGSYADNVDLRTEWIDNIDEVDKFGKPIEYVFLATDAQGNKSMQFDAENQFSPYFTETTHTFVEPQDWTANNVETLSLSFVGRDDNVENLFYLIIEDAAGKSLKVEHPFRYACQSEIWRQWDIALEQFTAAGLDLSSVTRMTIGLGDGTPSAQLLDEEDRDTIFIDRIRLMPSEQ